MPYGYNNNGGYTGGPMIDFGDQSYNRQHGNNSSRNTYHILILIFGILSVIMFFQSPLLAFAPGIAGLVMGLRCIRRQVTSTIMVVGFVLCSIALLFSIAYIVLIIWSAAAPIEQVKAFYNSFGFDIDRYKIK